MNEDEIYRACRVMVGAISPVGETNQDEKRFKNLQVLTAVVDRLLTDLDEVASNKTNHQYSVKRAGEYASKFLDKIGIPNN